MAIARNSLLSAIGAGVPVIVTIVTLPLLISQIGAERYGVLAVAWLILVYVGQADFGLGRASTRAIAKKIDGDRDNGSQVAATGIAVAAVLGLLTAAAAYLIAHVFFGFFLEVSSDIRSEAVTSVPLIAFSTFAVSMFGIGIASLAGKEQFVPISAFVLITNSALQLLPLMLAYAVGPDLVTLLVGTLAARLLGVGMVAFAVWRSFFRSEKFGFARSIALDLLHYGKWIMVSTICRPVMSMADRFIIGAQLGAVAVAAFSVPYQIASRTQLVPQAIVQVLFPRLSALSDGAALGTARSAVIVLASLSAPLMIALICMADPLLRLWLGTELDERSILIARLLLASFWLTGISITASTLLQARGKPRFTALWHLIQVIGYCIALLFAAPIYGLIGIAVVFLGRSLIDNLVLCWKARLIDANTAKRLAPAALMTALAVALHTLLTDLQTSLMAAFLLGSLATITGLMSIPPQYRQQLFSRFGGLRGR